MSIVPIGEEPKRPLALFGYPIRYLAIALVVVVAVGIYVALLLFGEQSLAVLLGLEEQRATFERHIKALKEQNAAYQKSYFELKELEPGS